ncbi:MAG: hypothetical protein H6567_04665 [Lewinellaceae bacterium]|nr:hypothetical protein [Lewinellaceae bacterium]
MRYFLIFSFCLFFITVNYGQNKSEIDSSYQANISKSKLYGIYIPRDLDDALQIIDKNTTDDGRASLRTIDEETMAKKLYFGLGRWMEYQWNFVEGSRFSHYLREKGLKYTEDMVRFMLITYHRHNIKAPLDTENLILQLVAERESKIKAEENIISTKIVKKGE